MPPPFETDRRHVLSLIMLEIESFPVPPAAGGATKNLLEKAFALAKNGLDFSGILYLAPGGEKRREAQKLFHEMLRLRGASRSYIPPLMLTPGGLAMKLLRESGGPLPFPSWLKAPLLMRLSGKSAGHAANISALMSELKGHFPGKKAPEILALAAPALFGLGIAEEVGERLGEALGTIALYDETLEKNGFLDVSGATPAAVPLIDALPLETLILDGFYEFSPAEKLLLRALIEKAGNAFAAVPRSQKYPEITEDCLCFLKSFRHREIFFHPAHEDKPKGAPVYFACPSKEEEVESAARRIKINYISGFFTDLSRAAVVVPSLSGYTDMIERVFVKYGVPCSFPAGAKNSPRARMEKDLLAAFDLGGDYGARPLASLLSSPFFTELPEKLGKWAATITLSGVAGGFQNWSSLKDAPHDGLKWLRKKFLPLKRSLKEGKTAGLLHGYLEALRGLGFSAGGYEDEFEDRLSGLLLLDYLYPRPSQSNCSGGCGPGNPGANEFREALAGIASGIEEEREEPGVRVLGFREAEGTEPESLYFLGLKDGEMPARPEADFFLPERLRAELGLRTMKKSLLIDEFLFQRLTSGPRSVYLSYPEMEADKVFLPSIFISDGQPARDPGHGIFSKEEEFVRKGGPPYRVHLKEITAACNSGKNSREKGKKTRKNALNVTDVDAFRACPRFFYMERVLGLSPAEAARYGLEPKVVGTLLHAIMESLMPVTEEDDESLRTRARHCVEAALAQSKDPVPPYWGRLLTETFLAALPGIRQIEQKFRIEGFTKTAAVLEGKIEGKLRGTRLKGKIDRIDENAEGGRRILDYKTGPASLNPGDVLRKGTSLQLFLYAALARSRGLSDIKDVGIYSLKDLKVKLVPGRADKKEGRTIEDYMEAALGYLEEAVAAMDAGEFRAAPASEQSCRNCHEKPYCPYIHGGTQ